MIDKREAKKLIKIARRAIRKREEIKPEEMTLKLKEKKGAFITLKTFPEGKLRGCIGIPRPRMPLYKAVVSGAISAAYKDPRFPPLNPEELDSIVIELSVLTKPQEKEIEDPEEDIEVGKDGLIVSKGGSSGLLLPQVAADRGWSSEKFLEETCRKARLPKNAWKSKEAKIKTFQAQVFREREPGGQIKEL